MSDVESAGEDESRGVLTSAQESDSEHSCEFAALQRVVLALWHARVHMLRGTRREDCQRLPGVARSRRVEF